MIFTKIINQATLADLLSAMISCLTLVLTAGTLKAAQPGNWYEKSRVGLFVHYVPELTVFPAGGSTTDINVVANGFDAQQLADDAAAFGMEYIVFTAWHYRARPLYPSAVTAKWRSVPSPTRDVIRDLITAIKPKVIKLILYVHSTDGHDFSAPDAANTGWEDATGGYLKWNNYVTELFIELGSRYKTDISGLWLDMCFDGPYQTKIDKKRLRHSMLTGNASRILICNEATTGRDAKLDAMDYPSAEYYPGNDVNAWTTYAHQIATVVGGQWWANTKQGTKAARLTSAELFRFTVLQSATTKDGGMAWDAGTYIGGGWETGVKEMFTGFAKYLRPIAASIKGTVPSTSFITAPNTSLKTLGNGTAATKSPDNKFEYLHVLNPPTGTTLDLPVPADAKKFTSATMLVSGRAATLVQDATGVHITIPEAWDPLNTVIKLAAR